MTCLACGCVYAANGGLIEACAKHPGLPGSAAYDPPAPPSPFLFIDQDTLGRGGIR
jgi:hypothetical protein